MKARNEKEALERLAENARKRKGGLTEEQSKKVVEYAQKAIDSLSEQE